MSPVLALRTLVEKRFGIALGLEEARRLDREVIATRALEREHGDTWGYLDLLASLPSSAAELGQVASAVTNGHTSFFRDPDQFTAVAALLRWLVARSPRLTAQRPLQIWSAGCATGEEAYSLVVTAIAAGVEARVLGTDLNPHAIAAANTAIYKPGSLRHTPEWARTYFEPCGPAWRPCAEVRARVSFRRHNLVEEPAPVPGHGRGWDLILCRNVFIYFERSRATAVARSLAASLQPEGFIVLGLSDPITPQSARLAPFAVAGQLAYRLASAESVVGAGSTVTATRAGSTVTPERSGHRANEDSGGS